MTPMRPCWQTLPPGHEVVSAAVSSGGVTWTAAGVGSHGFEVSFEAGTTVQCSCEYTWAPGLTVTNCGLGDVLTTFVAMLAPDDVTSCMPG